MKTIAVIPSREKAREAFCALGFVRIQEIDIVAARSQAGIGQIVDNLILKMAIRRLTESTLRRRHD